MALDFPTAPSIGQNYTNGSKIWIWNGTYWASAGGLLLISTGIKSISIANPAVNDNVTMFYSNSSAVITAIRAVLSNGIVSPSVTFSIVSGADRSTITNTHVNAQTVTSTTSMTNMTIANNVIPSSSYVWAVITAVSGSVPEINITLEF